MLIFYSAWVMSSLPSSSDRWTAGINNCGAAAAPRSVNMFLVLGKWVPLKSGKFPTRWTLAWMNLNELIKKAAKVTRGTAPQLPVMRSLYSGAVYKVYMVSDHQRELLVCCLFMSSSPDKTTPEGGGRNLNYRKKGTKIHTAVYCPGEG